MTAIHWLNPISGSFTNGADWSGGAVPGAADDAILDAAGASFTVTSTAAETVNSVQLAANAVLVIGGGAFAATAGTGAGVNAGFINVSGGGSLSVAGTLNNAGTIATTFAAGMHGSLIAVGNLTLAGGGVIDDDQSFGVGARRLTVTNLDNTIVGDGYLFTASPVGTKFVNKSRGFVDTLELGGGNQLTVINNGTIGSKTNYCYVDNCVISGTGTISVASGMFLQFDEGGTVTGQTFSIAANGLMDLAADSVSYAGQLGNAGTMRIYASGALAQLSLQGDTTLSGGGIVSLANATIGGAGAMLFNIDNTITGQGALGAGEIGIVNEAAGVIDSASVVGLTVDCLGALANAGLVEANGKGDILTVVGAVDNTGVISSVKGVVTLEAGVINDGVFSVRGGQLTVGGAVSGTGSAVINKGVLVFTSSFSQSVSFKGTGGLELGQSQGYAGAITGFNAFGGTTLDLRDIGFVGAGEASFSGTTTSGVLTVTDGTHTAHITLNGDYLGATFVAGSDGAGGTDVIATSGAASAPPHRLIAAMAGLGGSAGEAIHPGQAWTAREAALARPHAIA